MHWCGGEDFDGCIVFDECHKAKTSTTSTASAVRELQQRLPLARVLYVLPLVLRIDTVVQICECNGRIGFE